MNLSKCHLSRGLAACLALGLGALALSAQNYYDDDLYYDASKASKKSKPAKQQPARNQNGGANGLYYFDGTDYVPWSNVGEYQDAGSVPVTGAGSNRDVDEYNRHYTTTASSRVNPNQPDSMSLEEFERMSATERLARFNGSNVARQAMEDDGYGYDYDYSGTQADAYNNAYASGYSNGYNAGYNNADTSVSINFGLGYPYYYSSWGWPYYSRWSYGWPYYSSWYYPSYSWSWGWNDPYWSWGWGPLWGWGPSWGWTPSWGWNHGWGYGRPQSPSAAHRPRSTGYGRNSHSAGRGRYGTNRGSYGSNRGSYGSSSRPGYRQPINVNNVSGGSYTPSTGRNSHFGTSSGSYRPSSGSSRPSSGSSRPSYNSGSRSGSYSPSHSTRSSSSFTPSSGRSGGYSGGSYSGGSHSSGSHGGGGGHRSR